MSIIRVILITLLFLIPACFDKPIKRFEHESDRELMDVLEPDAGIDFRVNRRNLLLTSIAISVKRIADSCESASNRSN